MTTVTKRSFSESDSTKMYSSSILSLNTTSNKTVMVQQNFIPDKNDDKYSQNDQ